MRIRDLEPGRWYAAKHGIKRSCELVVLLLDVEPHRRDWSTGRIRPLTDEDRRGRPGVAREIRQVPVVRLEPIVWLADGSAHETEWSWDLHVPGLLGYAGRSAGHAAYESMAVRAEPDLLAVTLIDHELPVEPIDLSWAFGWFDALRLGVGSDTCRNGHPWRHS